MLFELPGFDVFVGLIIAPDTLRSGSSSGAL